MVTLVTRPESLGKSHSFSMCQDNFDLLLCFGGSRFGNRSTPTMGAGRDLDKGYIRSCFVIIKLLAHGCTPS